MDLCSERIQYNSIVGQYDHDTTATSQDQWAVIHGEIRGGSFPTKIEDLITMLDRLYGRTEAGEACTWLDGFTSFCRETGENMKDFWSRFERTTTRQEALNMKLSDHVIFNKDIQALELPAVQLPAVLSAI